jgi:hypothetical protein
VSAWSAIPSLLPEPNFYAGKDEQFAYKRALPRLIEMTSVRYAAEEQWAPLSPDVRKWEHTAPSLSPRASAQLRREHADEAGNFANKAAYMQSSTKSKERPESPRIRPHHVWGIGESPSTSASAGDGKGTSE